MVDFGYCAAWPDELKELSRRHYRAVCRVRCLDAAIARVDPASFDDIMDQLEAARKMQYQTGADFWRVKWQWETEQLMGRSYTDDATARNI